MNLNKLSIALAISAVSISGAFAQELSFAPDVINHSEYHLIAACTTNDCPQVVTPGNVTCPIHKDKQCDCQKHEDKNPCQAKKDTCKEKENTCEAVSPCEEEKVAAEAMCPVQNKDEKPYMVQTYAYPAAVYGNNQVIGDKNAGLYIGDNVSVQNNGVPVARGNDGNNCGCPCVEDTTNNITAFESNTDCGCGISIETENSMEATKRSLQPYEISAMTGAAAPLVSVFEDVPDGYWAGCDINKLTENNIIAGYPDRTFKPSLPVSRAEMASLTVKGFNLENSDSGYHKTFRDVPNHFWGKKMIDKAVANGLMAGYNDDHFRPNEPVSRAEAFTILSKGISCEMDMNQANEILNKYCDANSVPDWAKISVAKAIQAGALNDAPKPDMINPNKDASRAEIASMLENIRVSLGYSNVDKVSAEDCGCTGAAAYIEHEETVQLPTLTLNFNDEINAKSSNIGDRFAATTTEDVTVNGVNFPCGSTVRGKILEVNRPSKNCQGSLKLVFESIQHEKCKADLPQQVLSAKVNKNKKQNLAARIVTAPFTWAGSILGTAGRTVGGALVSTGNAVENVVNGVGIGSGEIFQGQFKAAGRSYVDAAKSTIMAPIDVTRTALSGAAGLFQTTVDEVAYLVDPSGAKISSVNPRESVTIAFGCQSK